MMQQARARSLIAAVVCSGSCLGLVLSADAAAAKGRPSKPPPAESSFDDSLHAFDSTRWEKADGWSNGSPFDNAWSAENVTFDGGAMRLRLDDQAMLGEPYTSGEYRTKGYYGYGCFEAAFSPVAEPGIVTSFFTYAGPYDNGGNGRHNEIDVEFTGDDTSRVQFNFWTNDDDYSSRNEVLVDLGFDASQAPHAYGFKWTSQGIQWFVDGLLVFEAFDSRVPTPKAADSLHKIMMNLWAVDETAENWAGTFEYPGEPLNAVYEWTRYTAGEDCSVSGIGPEDPAPPEGLDPDAVYVADLALDLNSRATQVVARVTVRDAAGHPAGGITVSAAWSGIITGGDTSRETDADGIATFYSSRSRSSGSVTFCVLDLSGTGVSYAADADLETCDTISK